MEFHDLLTVLINWVGETETEVFKLDRDTSTSSSDIRNEVHI